VPLLPRELDARLRADAPLVLDGATGTELECRGVPTGLPLWSAPALLEHADVVRRIHADYVEAGVGALTANTFRTQARALAHGGMAGRAAELCTRAVALAREAAGEAAWVFGSAPPLEDCYRPDLVPPDAALAEEHAAHAENLVRAGVDAILVETHPSAREARAAARAAREAGAPSLVSFVCWDGARLLSGEPLAEAVAAVLPESPRAVLVNCLPPSNVAACLAVLARGPLPFGVYANLGEPEDVRGFRRSEDLPPERFADHARRWRDAGAALVGGCCGTTPAHLAAAVRGLRRGSR